MSSQKSAPALQIDLRPSRYLFIFILGNHGGALLLLLIAPLSLWLKFLLPVVVLVSLRHHCNRLRQGYNYLRWDSSGQWWLRDQAGNEVAMQLLPGSYVHPLMLVLRFSDGRGKCNLLLLPDSADRSLLRRLRVRIKQIKPFQTVTAADGDGRS